MPTYITIAESINANTCSYKFKLINKPLPRPFIDPSKSENREQVTEKSNSYTKRKNLYIPPVYFYVAIVLTVPRETYMRRGDEMAEEGVGVCG